MGFIRELRFWRVVGALACLLVATSLMNVAVFPLFDPIFTHARDISVTANALILVVVGLLAAFRPQALHMRAFDALTVGGLVIGLLVMLTALATENAPLLVISSSLEAMGRAGVVVLIGLGAVRMGAREASIAVVLSFLLTYLLRSLLWGAPLIVGVVLFFLLPLAAFPLVFRAAQPILYEAASAEAPADVAIVRPSTFLPLTSHVFVCILIFRVAFGYSLRFGEVSGVPTFDAILVLPLALIAVLLVAGLAFDADRLAKVALLTVVMGFFLVGAPSLPYREAATVLLSFGNTLFDMVAWVLLIVLAGRNRAGAVAVFAWGRGMASIGTLIGAALGVWGNGLMQGHPEALLLFSGGIVALLVAYALFGLAGFSFQRELEGVSPLPDAESALAAADGGEGEAEGFDLDARCAELAAGFGLSPREQEVFRLLAEGRDRAYIEEQLVVSRNTVKAHVKHIYAKLGIHAHQDLIALVRDEG